MVYFIIKHLVDKHNLVYLYIATGIDNRTHKLAIKFVLFSVVMIQVFQAIEHAVRSVSLIFVGKLSAKRFPEIMMAVLTPELWSPVSSLFSAF